MAKKAFTMKFPEEEFSLKLTFFSVCFMLCKALLKKMEGRLKNQHRCTLFFRDYKAERKLNDNSAEGFDLSSLFYDRLSNIKKCLNYFLLYIL